MTAKRITFILVLIIAAGALAARLPNLGRRPMHLDEAVHAVKCDDLRETGVYHYDLHEYHGPTLYYLTLPILWLSGADTFADTTAAMYRLVPTILGVGLILLLLLVMDGLGRVAVVCAAVLTAVSPAMTYYGRYYIQETLLVFFTFAAIACGWRFFRAGRAAGLSPRGPVEGRRLVWAILIGASIGLMHATKETCIIAWGALGLALAATLLWRWLARAPEVSSKTTSGTETRRYGSTSGIRHVRSGQAPTGRSRTSAFGLGVAALLTAALVSVTLYSGFFTSASGPLDSVRTFATYFDRAGGHGLHDHPWYYYLKMLVYTHYAAGPWWSEGLVLALAVVGAVVAITGRGARDAHVPFLRFLTVYTLLMTVVYSAIPYKTPWCMLSFLHGMILLAGVGAAALIMASRKVAVRVVVSIALIAPTIQLSQQSARASSARFECDARNPYVYAHTVRDVENLAGWIDRLSQVHPDGKYLLIKVIADGQTYWPLPWYLRGYQNVGYWETPPEDADAPIVITTPELLPELQRSFKREYIESIYGVRSDAKLVVCVDRDLYETWKATQPAAIPTPE